MCTPKLEDAKTFINDGNKFTLMKYSFAMHASALTLHWLSEFLYNKGIKILANLFIITKMSIYLILILKI